MKCGCLWYVWWVNKDCWEVIIKLGVSCEVREFKLKVGIGIVCCGGCEVMLDLYVICNLFRKNGFVVNFFVLNNNIDGFLMNDVNVVLWLGVWGIGWVG